MKSKSDIAFIGAVVIIVLTVNLFLLMVVMEMPIYGQEDNPSNNYVTERYIKQGVSEVGGYNMVSNILLEYRAYDTFLETTIIFSGVVAVTLSLAILREK